jgi:hypothetical protein
LLAVLALLSLAFTQAVAQNKSEKPSLAGAKIFIEPMEGDLHPFIAAEIVKKELPVAIVTEKKNTEYILAGSFIKGGDKWNRLTGGRFLNATAVSRWVFMEKSPSILVRLRQTGLPKPHGGSNPRIILNDDNSETATSKNLTRVHSNSDLMTLPTEFTVMGHYGLRLRGT